MAAQPRHVAALAGLSVEAAATAADRLARESIVTAKRPVSFMHPLVRTAVYLDSSSLLRAAEHKRAARVLAADDAEAEQFAPHLLAAEPESDPWVVNSLQAAAVSALGRGARTGQPLPSNVSLDLTTFGGQSRDITKTLRDQGLNFRGTDVPGDGGSRQ